MWREGEVMLKYESTTFFSTLIHLDCFSLMSVSVFVKLYGLLDQGVRRDPTFKEWIVTATRKLETTPAEFA